MNNNDNGPDAKTILTQARQIIVERGWGQYHLAKDKDGQGSDNCTDPSSHSFCVVGAIHAVNGTDFANRNLAKSMFRAATGIGTDGTIPNWNDAEGRTREEVLAAFDAAIEYAVANS